MSDTTQLAKAMAETREEQLRGFMNFMEETVELPSRGIAYPSGSSSVKSKPMRGIEEDILTNQKLVRTGKAFDMIVKNCVTDWNGIDPEELLFGDLNTIYVALRSISYGSEYKAQVVCPDCGEKTNLDANLSEFSIKPLEANPVNAGTNLFTWTSMSGIVIKFRMLTSKDSKVLDNIERQRKANKEKNPETTMTDFLTQIIVSLKNPGGMEIIDKLDIKRIIREYLPLNVIQEFTSYVNEIRPDLDMTVSFECPECGAVNKLPVPITAEFFWPAGRGRSEGVVA